MSPFEVLSTLITISFYQLPNLMSYSNGIILFSLWTGFFPCCFSWSSTIFVVGHRHCILIGGLRCNVRLLDVLPWQSQPP